MTWDFWIPDSPLKHQGIGSPGDEGGGFPAAGPMRNGCKEAEDYTWARAGEARGRMS